MPREMGVVEWWEGRIIKEHEAALGTDAHVHYLDCGGAYMYVKTSNHTLTCVVHCGTIIPQKCHLNQNCGAGVRRGFDCMHTIGLLGMMVVCHLDGVWISHVYELIKLIKWYI